MNYWDQDETERAHSTVCWCHECILRAPFPLVSLFFSFSPSCSLTASLVRSPGTNTAKTFFVFFAVPFDSGFSFRSFTGLLLIIPSV